MCGSKATSVVCIGIPDAHNYLANSYRPYQERNNRLAATYDGAHGQAAQAQVGLRALHNATAENASPLAVAGPFVAGQRSGTKRSGAKRSGAKRSGTKTSEPAGGRRADRRIREALPAQWEI